MTTKVEEVARAIYEGRNGTGCKAWARLPKAHREPYRLDALNAIHEMREPTEPMERAGDIPGWDDAVSIGHSADVWRAMIDAALSEEGAVNEA